MKSTLTFDFIIPSEYLRLVNAKFTPILPYCGKVLCNPSLQKGISMDIYRLEVDPDSKVPMSIRNILLFVAAGKSALAAMGAVLALAGALDIATLAYASEWYEVHVIENISQITIFSGILGAGLGLIWNIFSMK